MKKIKEPSIEERRTTTKEIFKMVTEMQKKEKKTQRVNTEKRERLFSILFDDVAPTEEELRIFLQLAKEQELSFELYECLMKVCLVTGLPFDKSSVFDPCIREAAAEQLLHWDAPSANSFWNAMHAYDKLIKYGKANGLL